MLLPGIVLAGHYETYSEVPVASFVLAGLAPVSLALLHLPGLRGLTGWRQWLVGMLLVAAPMMTAIVLAAINESVDFG